MSKRPSSLALGPASALVLALSLLAPALPARQDVHTRSGNTLHGTILADDGKAITFRTQDGVEMTMPYGDLAPETVFELMAAKVKADDGPGLVQLADQAALAGLYDTARRTYGRALAADKELGPAVDAKLASLRLQASNALLADATESSKRDRPDVAVNSLARLIHVFPDEPAAQQARPMLAKLQAGMTQARKESRARMLSTEVQDALAPSEAQYAEMGKKISEGLQRANDQGNEIDDYNAAVAIGKSTLASLKEQAGQASTIPGLGPAIQQLEKEVLDQTVNAYVQLANVYNQRSSYNDANTAVNAGLALDPKNEQLLQLRAEIASNAAEGEGYIGWGRRGRGEEATPLRVEPHRR